MCASGRDFRLPRPPVVGSRLFFLKDANARLDAVIWRTTLQRMRLKPEEGSRSSRLATDHLPGKSTYQIVIDTLELAGRR